MPRLITFVLYPPHVGGLLAACPPANIAPRTVRDVIPFMFSRKRKTRFRNEAGRWPCTSRWRVTTCEGDKKERNNTNGPTRRMSDETREQMRQRTRKGATRLWPTSHNRQWIEKSLSSRSHLFTARRPCRRCDAEVKKLPLIGLGIHSPNTLVKAAARGVSPFMFFSLHPASSLIVVLIPLQDPPLLRRSLFVTQAANFFASATMTSSFLIRIWAKHILHRQWCSHSILRHSHVNLWAHHLIAINLI